MSEVISLQEYKRKSQQVVWTCECGGQAHQIQSDGAFVCLLCDDRATITLYDLIELWGIADNDN